MTKGPGLSEDISHLEEVKQELAKQYELKDIDSVEAFYAEASRALSGRDSNSAKSLDVLHLVLLQFRDTYFAGVQREQIARLKACLADRYVGIFILDGPDLVKLKINNVAPLR